MENYIGFVLWGGAVSIVGVTRRNTRDPGRGFG